jgi:SAM-dependent methyltransferase
MFNRTAVHTGLAFCIPLCGRPVPWEWAMAFRSLDPPINYNVFYNTVQHTRVDAARNHFAQYAKQEKAKYLFMMGDDTVPPGHTLRKLVYLMDNNPEIDVLGAMYWTKSDPSFPLVFRGNGAGAYWDWKLGEFFECTGLGMDATIIRTSIFDKLDEKFPGEPYFLTIKADGYAEDLNKTETWTEDLYFCDKVQKIGGKIFMDSSLQCDHYDVWTGKKYSMPWNCRPALRCYATGDKKVLDLGCGMLKIVHNEGVPVRVDLREDSEPDFRCDVRSLPFEDESWDIVFSSHTLEHFPRAQVPIVLDEWLRVLKPGGMLRLTLPDLTFSAKQILENGKLDDSGFNVLYGQQSYDLDYHQNGWTPAILREMLVKKGLKVEKIWQAKPYNIFCEARKVASRQGTGDAEGRLISKAAAEGSKNLEDQVRAEGKRIEAATMKAEKKAKRSGILKRVSKIMETERQRKADDQTALLAMGKADKPNGHAKVKRRGKVPGALLRGTASRRRPAVT